MINLAQRKGTFYDSVSQKVVDKPITENPNILYFASSLELKVYQSLVKIFGKERVICQVPITIKPITPKFPGNVWRVDFAVMKSEFIGSIKPSITDFQYFIEAKGQWVSQQGYKGEFIRTMQLLEIFNPYVFERLIVCSDKQFSLSRNVSIVSLNQALYYLKNV